VGHKLKELTVERDLGILVFLCKMTWKYLSSVVKRPTKAVGSKIYHIRTEITGARVNYVWN